MIRQLRQSGRLAKLAGLVVGQFTDMRLNVSLPFGKDAYEIIADVVADYDFPVLSISRQVTLRIIWPYPLVILPN